MTMNMSRRAAKFIRNRMTEVPRLHLKPISTFTGDWKGANSIDNDLFDSCPNMVSRLTKASPPDGGWKSPQNAFYHRIGEDRLCEACIPLKKGEEVLDLLKKGPLAGGQLQRRQFAPTKGAIGFARKPRSETGRMKCVLAGPNHMDRLGCAQLA
jgi:hypothetical protein